MNNKIRIIGIMIGVVIIFNIFSMPITAEESEKLSSEMSKTLTEEDLADLDLNTRKPISGRKFLEMAEEVVARVGGKEIKKKNVWEMFYVARDTKVIPPFDRDLLNIAISNELIYQEGLRRGLDKTDEFQRELNAKLAEQRRADIEKISRTVEKNKFREFSRSLDQDPVTQSDIDELFPLCRSRYPQEISDKEIKENLHAMLSSQGPFSAYQKWLAGLFRKTAITANGKPLLLTDLADSLEGYSLRQGLQGIKAGEKEALQFSAMVKERLSGKEALADTVITVGTDSIEIQNEPLLQQALNKKEDEEFARLLFKLVKDCLLAQAADRKNLKIPQSGPLWETPPEKSVIVSILTGRLVEEESEADVTAEEVIDYYQSHPMYQAMSPETAKKRIYQRLKSEKTRQAALDRLKERFKVEILIP